MTEALSFGHKAGRDGAVSFGTNPEVTSVLMFITIGSNVLNCRVFGCNPN